MDYTKNALDYTQILAQLKARGLLFKDEERAVEMLTNISYFRIANYLRYFEIDADRHLYKPDTCFEDAVYIYYFDKKLRSLLFTAIQSIEVSLRSKVIHHVALSHGPFWFADSNLCMNTMMYVDNRVKKQIARLYNLPQHQVLESWIKCIVILRNCLAHHARVWNRRFPQMPQLSMRVRGNWVDCTHIRPNKLYAQLCCLAYLLDSIYPQNDFKAQLKNLLSEYPEINIHYMGFPNGWESQPLWI